MKKYLVLFTLIIFTQQLFGFTLFTPTGAHFASSEITVNVANSDCVNAGISPSELLDKFEEAMDMYWNSVPTSSINLKRGGVAAVNIYTDTIDQVSAKVEHGTILIGCNSNTSNVFTSSGIKGMGGMTYSGSTILKGYLVIRDTANYGFDTLSVTQQLALIAHESGHAIGIGHSGFPTALMYYTLNGNGAKIQEKMTMDDYDAVTYLYPNESPGRCVTVSISNSNDNLRGGLGTVIISFFIGAFFSRAFFSYTD
jgi:hypothetical protein